MKTVAFCLRCGAPSVHMYAVSNLHEFRNLFWQKLNGCAGWLST